MKQTELIRPLVNARVYGAQLSKDQDVTAVVNDSRKVIPGACFIAIVGERFDGHDAIDEVVAAGAKIIIVEELPAYQEYPGVSFVKMASTFRAQAMLANAFYKEPTKDLNVIAVTGTNGKTTTTNMISSLLNHLNRPTGLIGTMHYKVDQTYYPAVNTTPNALELQRLFREMLDASCQDAIIEASSHALALGRLWYTDVDCAIFTNLTREHLDYHQTMDAYATAKSLLFSQLGQRFYEGKPRLAILNMDDPYWSQMAQATAAEILTYSLNKPEATVYATDIAAATEGVSFQLNDGEGTYAVTLPMQGQFNIANYLAAFLCLKFYYQFSTAEILEATAHFKGVSGRMEQVEAGQAFTVVVDFAHTQDALENVLADLAKRPHRRLITVTGHSGGNRDSAARPGIGDILFKYSDHVVLTADNPRFESVEKIAKEIVGTHTDASYEVVVDRIEAVHRALQIAEPEDIILLAGKGGEGYQIIGDDKIPYDDVDVVKDYYRNLKEN